MAKRQGGRVRDGGRRPAKRGSGAGRLFVGFLAGLVVAAAAAGGVYWWSRGGGGTRPREVAWPWAGGPVAPKGDGTPARVPPQAGVVERPEPAAAAPAVPRASGENGAAGVPGEPVAAGGGQPPFGESEEVFEAGARVYGAQCASCHGRPGRAAAGEKGEDAAGQFWTTAGGAAVARQPVGVIFREISVGRPERQMPAYQRVLSESERWDLALLLKNAGGAELPDPVVRILRAGR